MLNPPYVPPANQIVSPALTLPQFIPDADQALFQSAPLLAPADPGLTYQFAPSEESAAAITSNVPATIFVQFFLGTVAISLKLERRMAMVAFCCGFFSL